MRKILSLAVLCLVLTLTLTSCVTSSAVAPAPGSDVVATFSKTLEGVCDLWSKIRDQYPRIKEATLLLRELGGLADDIWASFVWIDQHAAQLDGWLQLVCDARAGQANAHVIARETAGVDWDAVGSAILKVTAFALQSGLL